ncbi:MAG: 16S rRNA (cytosine(1402)-N(4))-methyltransferase RsmH [Bacilli bacterium]|nr:16S rRNA (cytosine(1402)-N(4))-methyltransferase RsmH [Bacilli bacterium]
MMKHISVLLNESIEGLNIKEDGTYVDCTLGYGGHSSEILKRIKKGNLFAFDQDQDAINSSFERLSNISNNFTIIKSNFRYMKDELEKREILKVDGVLFDLGVSSVQLDEADRGFSYHQDSKLDMRMDLDSDFSAYNVVNEYSLEKLIEIFFKYGEEKFSKNIAKNIVKRREERPIETTLELVEIIRSSVPEKVRREKHPARKVFQAIRIEVNHEIEILEDAIRDALSILDIGGRLCVITFHSLEDRIVKNVFKEVTTIDKMVKGLPNIPDSYLPDYKLVVNKAIVPSDEEVEANNRSRSSKLRIIERIK